MNEMELLARAGLIFSEALCKAYGTSKTFLTDYNQSLSNHVICMSADLVADGYFEKNWQERQKYYELKIDEIVGTLADERLKFSEVTHAREPHYPSEGV